MSVRIVRPGGLNPPRPLGSGKSGRVVRPMGQTTRSDFITTRCYSPSGALIWDGDHGSTVLALAVGPDSTIYQSGKATGALLGDSLFHKVADGNVPVVTAMVPGGSPVWRSLVQSTSGDKYSYGIAAGSNGAVYVGINRGVSFGDGYIAKLTTSNGTDTLHLPVAAFHHTLPGGSTPPFISIDSSQIWGRVRLDAANNVYVLGGSILKWVNDVEYWMMDEQFGAYYSPTGLGVSAAGVIATSSNPPAGGPLRLPLWYTMVGDFDNQHIPAFSTYITKITKPGYTDPGWPLPVGVGGYQWTGTSPSGLSITYDTMSGKIIRPVGSADPTNPDDDVGPSVPHLGGSLGVPFGAMAVNDSGLFVHSTSRALTAPQHSHEIRLADGTLVASLDHGGEINDAVVQPDGTVIVAGERVARADFPGF